jgi:penicillin-binding protein 1A
MKILKNIKKSAKVLLVIAVGLVLAGGGGLWYAFQKISNDIPEIKRVSDYRPMGVTQILSLENNQSRVMAEFYKERRYLTPYDQMPQKVVQAFLSAEDSTFFEHQGINILAILRAAIANFLAGQVVQGGSTITQQIAKSLYLSPERNFLRKARELFLALALERNLTKEEILYLYLNQIYLGSGAYGVQAAARTYFHKDVKNLTTAEMALIAGLPTAPGKYSPLLNPKKAKERQLYVLKRMKENKFITETEQKAASVERVKVFVTDGTERKLAPHFVEYLRRHLIQKYGEKLLYEDGLSVTIPSAARYSQYAQEALESGLEEADQRKGYRGPIENLPEKEWPEFREAHRKELTKENFPYRFLTPEGALNLDEAIAAFDPTYEKTLTGKKVKALVTQIAPDKKSAQATIGLVGLQLPFEGMKWAAPSSNPYKPPKSVADVLHVGDVVWVHIQGYSAGTWKARLTQIPELQGALYSVDVESGQILAMVGGYNYETSEFNRAVQAKRQMGSTFKPIIYSAALEKGYTPASIIVDSPVVFEDKENGVWKPENYEEKFYGDTTFRQALINSRNIPTVKIVQDIKVQTVIEQAKRLGIDSTFNPDLSISLGSAVTTVQDLVHAFTAFPMLGKPFRANVFQSIKDRDGRTLETSADLPVDKAELNEKVDTTNSPYSPVVPGLRLDPRVAYVMTYLMKEVVQFGTAAKANSLGRPVAGKTGTTQDFRDGWFIGFSPRVVTGVWVGYDEQKSMGRGETGANTALPIWIKYMSNVLKDYPMDDFQVPEGVTFVGIDPKTGRLSSGPRSTKEVFIQGTEPGTRSSDVTSRTLESGKTTEKPVIKIDETDDETLREER